MNDQGGNGKSRRRDRSPASSAGRVPPHDLAAEAAVLSAMILDPDSLYLGLEQLQAEHFYSDANRLIFEAAAACVEAKRPVDLVTMKAQLADWQKLERVGGIRYLTQIIDATPAVAHLDQHCDIVWDKWRLRELIRTCQTIAAEGYGDTGPVSEFIDSAERSIFELSRGPQRSNPQRIDKVLADAFNEMSAAAEQNGKITGVPSGFVDLDRLTAGLHDGELTIVAARPSMGKTALALNIAVNIAAGPDPYGAAVFSMEMPKAALGKRVACAEARVDAGRMRQGTLSADEWALLTDAGAYLAPLPLWFDDQPGLTLMQLRGKIRRLMVKAQSWRDANDKPLKLVAIVDYLQLMKGTRQRGDSYEREVSDLSAGLKALAMEFNIPVIVLSQLNRAVEARGGDFRPRLSDLRHSGSIEQDADTVIFIFREEYYKSGSTGAHGIGELLLKKQRNGPTGTVMVRYTASSTRFDNLAPGNYAEEDYGP